MSRENPETLTDLDLLRRQRAQEKFSMGWIAIEVTKRSLNRKDFYQECVKKLSSLKKRGFSRREKHREMNATSKLSTKHPSDILSSQNSIQHRCKAFIDPKTHTHTLNKSNQFYISKTS